MRKLFALLFVAAAFTFAACEKKGGETSNADSAKVDSMPAGDVAPVSADSMKVDSAATTAPAADSAASTHKK